MSEGIIRKGVGDGENLYYVTLSAVVHLGSEPVHANTPAEALELFLRRLDLPKQLRNAHGNGVLNHVEYAGKLVRGEVEVIDGSGGLDSVLTIDEEGMAPYGDKH